MEGIIIMIVLAIVGRLFSGNKENDKQQKQKQPPAAMPPFSNERPTVQKVEPTRSARPKVEVKSLDDFAQEVFGQLQQKTTQPVAKTPEPVVEAVKDVSERVESSRQVMQSRPQLGADRAIIQRENEKKKTVRLPNTQEDLVHSVIMAEVLGPPKAKQRRTI